MQLAYACMASCLWPPCSTDTGSKDASCRCQLPKGWVFTAALGVAAAQPNKGLPAQLLTRSAFVMPMPESMIVRVLLALSGMMWMYSSGLLSKTALLVRDSNLQHELDALGCKAQEDVALLQQLEGHGERPHLLAGVQMCRRARSLCC